MSDSSDEYGATPRRTGRARTKRAPVVELSDSDEDGYEFDDGEGSEEEDDDDSEYSVHVKPARTPKRASAATPKKQPTPAKKATPVKTHVDSDQETETSAVADSTVPDGDGVEEGKAEKKARPRGVPKTMATTATVKLGARVGEAWLMQCEKDPDLEGDIGAVGRVYVEPGATAPLRLDFKGYTFEGGLAPCASFMLVRIKDDEARVDAMVNHYMDLACVGSVLDKETVLEGQLDDEDLVDAPVPTTDDAEWEPVVPGAAQTKKQGEGAKASKKMRILESADVAPAVKKKATAKKTARRSSTAKKPAKKQKTKA